MYQQCGPVCPQTCENQQCSAGCAEECFCPDGMVLSNNKCINLTDCQGTYISVNILYHIHLNRCRAHLGPTGVQYSKGNKHLAM